MPRKKQKLQLDSSTQNTFNVKILPNEVWCIIFSYLHQKAVQNATESCKHWFELIRNDPNLSGHIILANDGLLEFTRKINTMQWIWTRWPVVKTLEFRKRFIGEKFKGCLESVECIEMFKPAFDTNNEITKYLSMSTSFGKGPTLKKILCWVSWHLTGLTGLFTQLPNLPRNFGSIHALAINPWIEIESVSIEHVSGLELSIDDSRFSETGQYTFNREILQAMKLIGEDGRNLKDLTISFPFSPCWIELEFSRLLQDAFSDMFRDLKKFNSLQIVRLSLRFLFMDSTHHIDICFHDSREVVTHLIVKSMCFESSDVLSGISHLFPKLQHIYIEDATVGQIENEENLAWDEDRSPIFWSSRVEETFQDSAKVEIYLKPWNMVHSCFHLLKLPFQKSVLKHIPIPKEEKPSYLK